MFNTYYNIFSSFVPFFQDAQDWVDVSFAAHGVELSRNLFMHLFSIMKSFPNISDCS